VLLLAPFCLRLLPLRKIEGFFVPALLRFQNSAASAGRIANRKQVTMQIIQSLHRKSLPYLFTLSLLAPMALGIAGADPATTTPSQSSQSAAPATAKTTSQGKTATASTPAKSSKASPTQPQPTITESPMIVVTAATRTPQPQETTAATTTVLTRQELDDAKYASVPDALGSVPGLTVAPDGMPGSLTAVYIHGMESRDTLVTVDGRRQAVGLDGQDDNLTNLTLDDVDQIEVVRTPCSAAQGGGAMGGVINIVTLSGKGLTTPESSVSEEAGSFNTFRENIQSRGAVDNFDYAVSATRQDSIYPALSTGTPGPFGAPGFAGQADQYRNTGYRGNFGYQITPAVYVDLHTIYSNAYSSSPGTYNFPDPTANFLVEDWSLSPEVIAQVTSFYKTKLYYTHDQQRQVYDDPYNLGMSFGSSLQGDIFRTQVNTESVDWQNDFQVARNWSITTGVQSDYHNFYQYDDGIGVRAFQGNQSNIGGYISSQWQPLPGLNILNSGRYDSYSAYEGSFSWRQGVSYRVAPTQTLLHASVARAFTPPTLQDTVYSYPPFYYPNPNLVPETDLGWEAGVEQPLFDDRVTPSATYFHNDLHNSIQPVGTSVQNIAQATTDGVEVGLTVKPCPTVTAKIGYTYLDAVNDTAQIRLIRRPRNSLDFTGTWQPLAPLTFTLGGDWVVGRQDYDPISGNPNFVAPDYFVLRATANYRINDHVSIWIRGENLTDRNYQPVLGYYAPSIAGYGGIKVSF